MRFNDNVTFAILVICAAVVGSIYIIEGPDGAKARERKDLIKLKEIQLDSMRLTKQKATIQVMNGSIPGWKCN